MRTDTASAMDLNDSGCVQDSSMCENGYKGHAQLLDLSDDVLLFILKYCSPRDLKALGFTCSRLGALVCDHTLWHHVDCRDYPTGQLKLRWFLTHCLTDETTELKLKGYVNTKTRCMGMENFSSGTLCQCAYDQNTDAMGTPSFLDMPRFSATPGWPDSSQMKPKTVCKVSSSTSSQVGTSKLPVDTEAASSSTSNGEVNESACSLVSSAADRLTAGIGNSSKDPNCPGPQFTLTLKLMQELKTTCGNLTSLFLEYCDIDCRTTNVRNFPRNLKKLSLRGSRCFNQPLNSSYFCKVHDYLLDLEYVDVSYCEWFEPGSLMPLSKVPNLQELYMRGCERLTECVAYTALAARFGFHQLRVLDVRESPLADSEVSTFGWFPRLHELLLAPVPVSDRPRHHSHRMGHVLPEFHELEPWELQEPEYYKIRSSEIPDIMPEEEPKPDPKNAIAEVMQGEPNKDIPWGQSVIVIQANATRDTRIQSRTPPAPHMYAGPSKRSNSITPLNLAKRPRRRSGMEENDPTSDNEMTWIRHRCYYNLITDSTVLMFGKGEKEHVVHIGFMPPNVARMRPDKSSLRVLSMPGFRNITDRSLEHLATAAPHLRLVDFSGTNVTEKGVEVFKALKPDCEIKYSKFVDQYGIYANITH